MARNEHFVYAFVNVTIVSGNDVFDVPFCKPTPFCQRDLMNDKQFFPAFRLESGKMQE